MNLFPATTATAPGQVRLRATAADPKPTPAPPGISRKVHSSGLIEANGAATATSTTSSTSII